MIQKVNSGDACDQDNCQGRFYVYCTITDRIEKVRTRYLKCNRCGHKPDNTIIVPLEFAPPQRART